MTTKTARNDGQNVRWSLMPIWVCMPNSSPLEKNLVHLLTSLVSSCLSRLDLSVHAEAVEELVRPCRKALWEAAVCAQVAGVMLWLV